MPLGLHMLYLKKLLWTSLKTLPFQDPQYSINQVHTCVIMWMSPLRALFQINVFFWYNPFFSAGFVSYRYTFSWGPKQYLSLATPNEQKILDACLISNRDENTDVHVVETSVFSLNSPGPQICSAKVRKTFSLVFRESRSLLFPKNTLKILFWYK